MKGTGLRAWSRDETLPGRAGDAALAPLGAAAVLDLVNGSMLREGAPAVAEAHWTYARWKPGISLCTAYELVFEDASRETLVAKRHAGDKAKTLAERDESRASAADGDWPTHLRPPLVLPDEHLYLWASHDDRELPALRALSDVRRSRNLLRKLDLFPGLSIRKRRSSTTLLRYRPERRAVVRMDLAFRDDDGSKSKARMAARALPPSRSLRVQQQRLACGALPIGPRLIGRDDRTGLLLEEWLEVDVPEPDDFDHALRAGTVLAALHIHEAPGGELRPEDDLSSLAPLFAWSPELVAKTQGLVSRMPGDAPVPCWTHGDFHPDQVVTESASEAGTGGGGVRLLDLDELSPGDPHLDLASWIADHLLSADGIDWDQAAGPLLAGYAEGGGPVVDETRLRTRVALALVQRAAASCRRLEQDAERVASTLLDRARELAPAGSLFR